MCDPADLEILGDAECRGCGHIGDHAVGCAYTPDELDRRDPIAYGGALWQEDPHNIFIPVSERLRLHYCEGAHAGLRGDWARVIRDEAALRALYLRRWRRAVRDESKTWQKT